MAIVDVRYTGNRRVSHWCSRGVTKNGFYKGGWKVVAVEDKRVKGVVIYCHKNNSLVLERRENFRNSKTKIWYKIVIPWQPQD